jgi:hypothetical protein
MSALLCCIVHPKHTCFMSCASPLAYGWVCMSTEAGLVMSTHAGWVAHLQIDFFGLSIKISLHQVLEKV